MTSRQNYRRYRQVALAVTLIVAASTALLGLTVRAIDATYGEPRCSQVTLEMANLQPTSWQPVGWRVEDGFAPLACPVAGRWYHLFEDGSLSPR